MKIVEFKDYDNQTTPLSAYNLNRLQQNLITTKYQMTFSSAVSGGSTITLPCYYQVGQDTLDVYLNSELLKKASTKDSEGHYYEVGNSDTKSNQIKITSDWSIASGDVLNLIVRGTTDSYDQNLSPDKATQLADEISANKEEITNARASAIKNKTFASVDARLEDIELDTKANTTDISQIKEEQTTQNENISTNADEITNLKNENSYLQNVVKQAFTETSASGTELTINNTIEARMEMKLNGNTSQNGEPTPDTPQEIHCVKGNNVVKVTNKNLFDESVKTGNTLTSKHNIISDSNGVLEIQGVSDFYSGIFKTYKLKAKTQYTISLQCDFVGDSSSAIIRYKLGNESEKISWTIFDGEINVTPTNTIKSISFTTDSTGQVSIMFSCNGATHNGYVKYSHIQLEQNDTATNFVVPQSAAEYPINLGKYELNSISDFKDYFKKENGKWYKVEKIKSIIADGTNYLCKYLFPSGVFLIYSNAEKNTLRDAFKSSSVSLFSNYLISKTLTKLFNGEVGASYNTATGEIDVNVGISSNKEDINTWLSTHNLMIKYILQTPNQIEITDTTLITQLDEISQALSKKGTTIISQRNDDLPFNLDVIALTK